MHKIITITSLIMAVPATNAALEVIGSGFGRTGTDTLRQALTELGYKTYHMKEIIDGGLTKDVQDWIDLAENRCSDAEMLKSVFERGGWTAAVDFPAAMCWEELSQIYPNAKVIHTERSSPEKWYESASGSILTIHATYPVSVMNKIVPFWRIHHKLGNALWSFVLNKKVSDWDPGWPSVYKNELMASYSARNKRVRKVVPGRRLLIQDHRKGWNSLAKFVGKDVPNKPYPHSNTRADFIAFFRTLKFAVTFAIAVFLAIISFLMKKMTGASVGDTKKKAE
jgi:hypothetical protein